MGSRILNKHVIVRQARHSHIISAENELADFSPMKADS